MATDIHERVTAWGEAEGVPVRNIPKPEFAMLRTEDGTLLALFREWVRDENGDRLITAAGSGFVRQDSWQVKAVSSPCPGEYVRPIAYAGITPVEQLLLSAGAPADGAVA